MLILLILTLNVTSADLDIYIGLCEYHIHISGNEFNIS